MSDVPETIYLQWIPENTWYSDAITWCEDHINDDDIEYVIATTADRRKELLMRWNDERVKEGEPCPFCKTCTQFDYAKGSHVKLVMIDVHADDCELEKELKDD